MLILLAALLLSGPPPARAQDSPAPEASVDAADANGDGTVTGKERRQKRRADRRARRGSKGEYLTDEEADAAEAAESSARGSAASSKAAGAAAALKNSLPSAGAGAMPGGGSEKMQSGPAGRESAPASSPAAENSAPAPSGGAKPSGDPGKPSAPSDFALAARSGYAPAFTAAGLKLGPDGKSVVRLDGKPATPEDYARLQREIGSMPAALGRRPDFFNAVSPGHYADLKRGYKDKKEGDAVYKDVGTTEGDRDFVHTASCSKLSGDCNKSVEKASYKKGDFVAPEDLESMWDALQKELDGSAEGSGLPSLSAARADVSRAAAIDAARALAPEHGDQPTDPRGDEPATASGGQTTAVAQAVASVRTLWKRAAGMASPASGGPDAGAAPSLALGAIALAVLGAVVLFFRRKT